MVIRVAGFADAFLVCGGGLRAYFLWMGLWSCWDLFLWLERMLGIVYLWWLRFGLVLPVCFRCLFIVVSWFVGFGVCLGCRIGWVLVTWVFVGGVRYCVGGGGVFWCLV